RDLARLDSATRPKITAHVKQNFVGFDVIVDPRNFDGLGVRIEQARRESTDDVTADFKCLMNGRRLMHRSGNWLEVLSVKGEGVDVAVPTNDVERMMRHGHARPTGSIFHQNFGVP